MTALDIISSLHSMFAGNSGLLGWTFIALAMCSILLYMTKMLILNFYGRYYMDDAIDRQLTVGQYTACSSPECVRCHRYQIIRSQAYNKLCEYADKANNSPQGLERLKKAVQEKNVFWKNEIQQPNVLYMPELKAKPWWDEKLFQVENDILTKEWGTVYKEFNSLWRSAGDPCQTNNIQHDTGWVTNNTPTGCWSVYHFYNQGQKVVNNCEKCPETTKVIESLPSFMRDCLFGNASFSILHPDTLITEHYGPCNIRIRCHLGLLIPSGCSLTVGGEAKEWKQGQCILFDDSFLHKAEYQTEEIIVKNRVVLLLDFWHPGLSTREKLAIKTVFNS